MEPLPPRLRSNSRALTIMDFPLKSGAHLTHFSYGEPHYVTIAGSRAGVPRISPLMIY